METNTFMPFLLVILSILFGIGGIALLVIGLIFSQKRKWIPGLVAFIIAIIMGIVGIVLSFRNVIEKINQNKDYSHQNTWANTVNPDSLFRQNSPVDSSYIDPVSGFIEDNKHNLIYTKIYPHRSFYYAGITLKKVTKGVTSKNNPIAVEITVDCDKAFSGKLNLSFFSQDKKSLGESTVEFNANPSKDLKINFLFNSTVDFPEADYGTLRIIEKE